MFNIQFLYHVYILYHVFKYVNMPTVTGETNKQTNTHTDTHMYERRKEMFYLMTHSTHFIYGYMVSDIWLRTIQLVREETQCRHMGYSFQIAARVLL